MYLRLFAFVAFLVLLNVLACSIKGKAGHDGLSISDCHQDRKNMETIYDKTGSIIMVTDQYILLSKDGNSRYLACNLPETYKKEGMIVTFSLVVKEIFPNERHIAPPAFLKEIKQINP